jgi:hypothetical protein
MQEMGVISDSTSSFINFEKAYDSGRTEVLYNFLIDVVYTRKHLGYLKCLNKAYNIVLIGKNLSDEFFIQYGLKQGDALSPFLSALL